MFLSARCSLLRAEGFFYSLDVLFGGLEESKLQFLIKILEKIYCKIFILFSFIKTLDLDQDPHLHKMLDPNPHPDPH
jgi:hypothetical protein